MARKSVLTPDALAALGAQRLAQIILDEAEVTPALRKRVNAALASTKGPDAVAKLIDRRLAALERAEAMVDWERERAFADDLRATVMMITKELGALSPIHTLQRLLRFVDTHPTVFERIDDSSGRIQDVYWEAADAVPEFVAKLPPRDLAELPDRLTISLSGDTHGLAIRITVAVIPLLPQPLLLAWDEVLSDRSGSKRGEASIPFLDIRQAIADALGDLDGFMALEVQLPVWRQNPLDIAERLLAAKRLDEALTWVRKERKGGLSFASTADLADGRINRVHDLDRVRVEAKILEAMKDRKAAQALRWAAFETTLNADILRDYIGRRDDFLEMDELDKAFAIAARSTMPYVALAFFIEWPRLDLGAQFVLDRIGTWDGRHYDVLGSAAEALEDKFPLAATILYRVLLNDILGRAKSPAYRHGARYFAKLGDLSSSVADVPHIVSHTTYVLGLRKAHGRKVGFWSLATNGAG